MNLQETKQAWVDGKTLHFRAKGEPLWSVWDKKDSISIDLNRQEWRIKPAKTQLNGQEFPAPKDGIMNAFAELLADKIKQATTAISE